METHKFGYNEQFLSHLCTRCKRDPVNGFNQFLITVITSAGFIPLSGDKDKFVLSVSAQMVYCYIVCGFRYQLLSVARAALSPDTAISCFYPIKRKHVAITRVTALIVKQIHLFLLNK